MKYYMFLLGLAAAIESITSPGVQVFASLAAGGLIGHFGYDIYSEWRKR